MKNVTNTKTYTKHKKNTKNDEWGATGLVTLKRTNKKPQCHRCKTCKDGCEFYDGGFCRGICYPTYPPKYGKCVFDVSGNETNQYFTDEEIDQWRSAMSNEASPRPWQVRYGDTVADATGAKVAACLRPDNAALIVDAVNERDLIAARLEAFDKKLEEAVAIHDALCDERDRLRDIVRRLITIHQNIFWRKDEKTGMLYYDCAIDEEKIRKTIEEARAAIGEDKP